MHIDTNKLAAEGLLVAGMIYDGFDQQISTWIAANPKIAMIIAVAGIIFNKFAASPAVKAAQQQVAQVSPPTT